ncbi:hypothetical protein GUJ93_ZPchr0001g29843 [Zizania palustris]|uniref:Uncharacterized protein n=1 Tax=Zizania palustris TaxID=103762 RepID=A0A8J5R736_ZIZPA|nr:hypothetical protein GUJ93_ZPchr0001g29843 [Zizania palustris]
MKSWNLWMRWRARSTKSSSWLGGAYYAFERQRDQLMDEVTSLSDRLAVSQEKDLDLEDNLRREQERQAAFEVEAEGL